MVPNDKAWAEQDEFTPQIRDPDELNFHIYRLLIHAYWITNMHGNIPFVSIICFSIRDPFFLQDPSQE